MQSLEIGELVDKWVKLMNAKDYEHAIALYATDVVNFEAPIGKTSIGIDYLIERFKGIAGASKDIHSELDTVSIALNRAIIQFTISGTNTGAFRGCKPTGRCFKFTTCFMLEIKNGKIVKHTSYLDDATILRAMGMLDLPGEFCPTA